MTPEVPPRLIMAAPSLTLEFDYLGLTDKNIQQLRVLNDAVFPVRYSDKFYVDVLNPDNSNITKLSMFV